jgi:peroxiredoxin
VESGAFNTVARVGEEAPDFSLPTPEGEHVLLSQFRGQKQILLEFGSITCPPFVGEVSPLNRLYARFRDKGFELFTIYVREPHPGEHYHEHRSWEQRSSMRAIAGLRTASTCLCWWTI